MSEEEFEIFLKNPDFTDKNRIALAIARNLCNGLHYSTTSTTERPFLKSFMHEAEEE